MLPVLCTGIQVCRQISTVWLPIGNEHFSFLSIEWDYITIPLQHVAAWPRQHAKRVLAPIEKFALNFWTRSFCFFKFQAFIWMLFICNSFHCRAECDCQMRESIHCRSVNAFEPVPTHLNVDILWSRDLNFVELATKTVERPVRFFIVRQCENLK